MSLEKLIHLSATSEPRAAFVNRVSHSPYKMQNTIRPMFKLHGAKFYLAGPILELVERERAAAKMVKEVYGGGANFLLQSFPPAPLEIYNDSDPLTANVYRVASDPRMAPRLLERLAAVKCDCRESMEGEFNDASFVVCTADRYLETKSLDLNEPGAAIGIALAFIVNRRMSRGGLGKSFAWSERTRGGLPGDINSWQTFVANHAARVCLRAKNWICVCQDALNLLAANGPDGGVANPDAFFYLDPPYLMSERKSANTYRKEMDETAHGKMLETICEAKAKVALSGYMNRFYPLYLTEQRGWKVHYFSLANHSGQGKKKSEAIECLWVNFEVTE